RFPVECPPARSVRSPSSARQWLYLKSARSLKKPPNPAVFVWMSHRRSARTRLPSDFSVKRPPSNSPPGTTSPAPVSARDSTIFLCFSALSLASALSHEKLIERPREARHLLKLFLQFYCLIHRHTAAANDCQLWRHIKPLGKKLTYARNS